MNAPRVVHGEHAENFGQNVQGSSLDEPATAPAKPRARKPPSGDWTFTDLHAWRRQRRKPRSQGEPLSMKERYKAVIDEEERAAERAEERRQAKERALAESQARQAAEFQNNQGLQCYLAFNDLLGAIVKRDLPWVAKHQRKMEERWGLKIELIEGWEAKLPGPMTPDYDDRE